MGKGKGKGKQLVKTSAKPCSCLLLPGEKATALVDYLKKIAGDIMHVAPPPGEDSTVAMVEGMLIDTAKEVICKLTHMVFRELDRDLCFESIEASNLVVTQDGLVKIRKDNTVDAWDNRIEANVHELGTLIHELVRECSDHYFHGRPNSELKHLLGLMKTYQVHGSRFLMKYPPATVPLSNRPFYYLLMHDQLLEIIRWNNPGIFSMVMSGLEIPSQWYSMLASNSHVKEFLDKGTYDPLFAKASTVPDIEPLRCLRNLPSHSREGAASGHDKNLRAHGCNASAPYSFSREDLARAIYARMPMVMCSMAKGLDMVGELSDIGVDKLFPGRLQLLQEDEK